MNKFEDIATAKAKHFIKADIIPQISVIIPAYNSEKTIKATIESVLKQSFSNWELIIINDGSKDSTLEIISQFDDSRIKVFSFDNAGGNVSRNRGLKCAVGEFVSFLDSDDIWTSDKLAMQLEALKKNSLAAVAYSWTDYINENGKVVFSGKRVNVNGDVYEKLLLSNFLENGSNPLIRRKALISLDGFDESLAAAQDWDMWLRLANKFNFVCVPTVQILYRIIPNSVSCNIVRQEKFCLQVIKDGYQKRPSILKYNFNISLANLYQYLIFKALQKPLNLQKSLTAIKFLWNYVGNCFLILQHMIFRLLDTYYPKIIIKIRTK
ncbi:MAG: glycosyltransferase [Nostoc sp. ChiQUE01a]|nr:glycosyltransferase [Nostoc sp. ChiQUE01a]